MIYFLLGIIFASFFQPVLEGLTAIILSFFELIKSKIAVGIAKSNKQIEGGNSHVIGFQVPDYDEEEDKDDE